ncbi:hypothetical protein KCU78_g2337, partial [Aureobasidium melanogenum]
MCVSSSIRTDDPGPWLMRILKAWDSPQLINNETISNNTDRVKLKNYSDLIKNFSTEGLESRDISKKA